MAGNAFRQDPNAPGVADAAKAFWDMGASTLRGGVASLAGTPGDLEEAIRALSGAEKKEAWLPTTERMKGYLPPVNPGAKPNPYESIGEWLNPVTPLKEAALATKGAAGLKAIMLATKLRDPQVDEAIEMTKKGANKYHIWQATQREEVPRANDWSGLPPQNRKWMREIDDSPAKIKPGPHMQGSHLVTGDYMLTDILDHPELFREAPRFKNVQVSIDPFAGDFWGGYNVKDKMLYLNPKRLAEKGSPDPLDVILHELQHDEQAKRGWSRGANTNMFHADDDQLTGMYLAHERGPHNPLRKATLEKTLRMREHPDMLYHYSLGEQQARAVESRRKQPQDINAFLPPSQNYEDLKLGFDSQDMEKLIEEASRLYKTDIKQFQKPMSQQLQDILKGWSGRGP